MEEIIIDSTGLNSEKLEEKMPHAIKYGHEHERVYAVNQRKNAENDKLFAADSDFKKVEQSGQRITAVNTVFETATNEMDTKWNHEPGNIYDKVNVAITRGKWENTDKQVEFIEKYSQTGILNNLREITFERSMAQKCEAKDSTKHTRRRKAKREKVFEKQKAALLAAADMSNKLYHNAKLEDNDEDNNYKIETTRKYAIAKRDAQQDYIDAMVEADKYDYENNIKMARTEDGSRVIDMGNGTSDYFASLFKLSSEYKIEEARQTLAYDYTRVTECLTGKEADRNRDKAKEFKDTEDRMKKKLNNDANKCFDRLPDLLIALNPDLRAREEEIRGKVDNFKNKSLESKITIVNNIIHNPFIMATFRKDMRELGAKQAPNQNKRNELADTFLRDLNA